MNLLLFWVLLFFPNLFIFISDRYLLYKKMYFFCQGENEWRKKYLCKRRFLRINIFVAAVSHTHTQRPNDEWNERENGKEALHFILRLVCLFCHRALIATITATITQQQREQQQRKIMANRRNSRVGNVGPIICYLAM